MNSLNPNFITGKKEKKERRPILVFPMILCLIIAFAIWVYATNTATENYEKTFNLVDISVEGAEELESKYNLSVVDIESGRLSVTVTGRRSDVASLSAGDFAAYIDLSTLDSAGRHACDIKVKAPGTVSVKTKNPSSISVSVDEIKSIEVPVTVESSSYSMNSEYYLGDITTDITKVTVEGPGGVLDRIVAARANIGLGSQLIESSLTQRLELTLVDEKGNAVESEYVSMDHRSATVNIPVLTDVELPLRYSFAEGFDTYLVESVTISPNTVKVTGDPSIVKKLNGFDVFVIDASTKAQSVIEFDTALLPSGAYLTDGSAAITVSVSFRDVTGGER